MDEIDYDTSPLYQEIQDILSIDTDEKFMTVSHRLTQLSFSDFSQLVNKHLELIFSNRQCDELITIRKVLMNPEKCSDPYIRVELMCFTFIFTTSATFIRQNLFITISEIVVDNYIPYIEGDLFSSHILIDLINSTRAIDAFTSSNTRYEFAFGARKLNKNHNDLLDEFYANIIDLLAELILIEIKCINFKNMSDVMLVCNDMVIFFDIYHDISKYIVMKYPKSPPLIVNSVTSAIAVITNCIFLFQAKLLASDIDSAHWSNMICRMEKLRNHMAILSFPPSSAISLQRFLIERSHGNFNTNCTKKLYNVTNNINQINISERSSDIRVQTSIQTFGFVLHHLKRHVNKLNANEYVNALYSSDESLASSGSEESNSETD
ncbi:unnamed protein product [Meganyctiphanes norvegica]|uniref:Uncharacterized protein n=1 Tax=Meganyctiphanes norvegica TaxID=48144 RepID=A0AAV2RKQ9_MEGNR